MTAIAAFYRHVSIEAFKVNWTNNVIVDSNNSGLILDDIYIEKEVEEEN